MFIQYLSSGECNYINLSVDPHFHWLGLSRLVSPFVRSFHSSPPHQHKSDLHETTVMNRIETVLENQATSIS